MKVSIWRILEDSRGLTLFMVIFVMAFLLVFLSAGAYLAQIHQKVVSNHKLSSQIVHVADAGMHHALAKIVYGWSFNDLLNCGTPPCTVIPQTSFPAGSGFSYTVTVQNDLADILNGGSAINDTNRIVVLNSNASGPAGTKRAVQTYIKRSAGGFIPPGALYLPASSTTLRFDGSSFLITGNDTAYTGLPALLPAPPVLGVATIHNSVTDDFKSKLGSSRHSLVQGLGFLLSPLTPSIAKTENVFDVNQIAVNFYNHPAAVKYLDGYHTTLGSCPSTKPCYLGTDAAPQITYIRESSSKHIHFEGHVYVRGVLVLEGKTHLYGNFDLRGLIVSVNLGLTGGGLNSLDDAEAFSIRNDAKVFGSVVKGPTNQPQHFDIRNNAKIYYSSEAMKMVNQLCATCLPQPARVFAWLDK